MDLRSKSVNAHGAAPEIREAEQSAFLRNILESSTEYSIIGKDLTGRIELWNAGARRIYGYAPEEVIGRANSSVLHMPEDIAAGKPKEIMAAALKAGKWEGTFKRVRKNDERFTARVVVTPRRDAGGTPIGFLLISKDISDEIRLTGELETAQFYARSLIEASLDPMVTISPEGKFTDVNEGSIKVTGVARGKLIGTDFSDYFTEPEKAREGYQQVFAQGFVTDYPLTIRHRDGRLTDVLYNASVYKDVAGNVLGVFAAARDVTETKRVMREFTETKNFLDNILQSSTKYSIIGKDLDHLILSWNEGARRNYGYAADEILGRNSEILHTPEDIKSGAVANLLTTAQEKGLAEDEFQRVRKDGSRFAASVVVTRRNDASGQPIGYLLMSHDISEKKLAEEQLRYASQYARSLIEASVDPLVTISPEGKITDVNEGSIKVTGVRREELIGTDFSNYFTEPAKAREGYQQVFAKGFVTDYPLTIRHRNGQLTDVSYNASVYKDTHGDVLGVFAAARDVTAQKKAEAEVAEQRTNELERLAELERFQKLTVGRELKMIELKKEIDERNREIEQLKAARAR